MKPPITLLIVLVLAYLALSFVSWDINPAHWSAIARTVLLIVFLLAILKPVTDWLKLTIDPEKTNATGVTTRTVSEAEYEQNRQFYQKALSMKVGEFTPEQRQSIKDTLAKAKTLLARLEKEDVQIG
jgi:hypothetical protein